MDVFHDIEILRDQMFFAEILPDGIPWQGLDDWRNFRWSAYAVLFGEHLVHFLRLQIHAQVAVEQAHGLVEIGAQFFGRAGASGIIAGALAATGQGMFLRFETHPIVALPGMDGDSFLFQSFKASSVSTLNAAYCSFANS